MTMTIKSYTIYVLVSIWLSIDSEAATVLFLQCIQLFSERIVTTCKVNFFTVLSIQYTMALEIIPHSIFQYHVPITLKNIEELLLSLS